MFSALKGGNENVAVFKYNITKNIFIKHKINYFLLFNLIEPLL